MRTDIREVFMVIFRMFIVFVWISGIVIAAGFWSTFFAIFVPFWGWYLVIERIFWPAVSCM